MSTQVLRGKVEPLALIDVLAYLGRNGETGVLNVVRDDVQKSLAINEGAIIFARSNQVEDRLGDILLAKGVISQSQYEKGTELIYEKGYRHGRALIEIGAITPKVLWHTIREQIHGIALSVIPWDSGQFEFIKQEIPKQESITLELTLLDLVLDVVRNLSDRQLFKTRFPDMREIFAVDTKTTDMDSHLEPHERHLMTFIDGKRTTIQICDQSDYGEAESLRVMYLLRLLGRIQSIQTSQDASVATHPLIASFNKIFAFLHQYLEERVGAVGVNLLKKYFAELNDTQPIVFDGVKMLADGVLDPVRLQRNMNRLADDQAEMIVDEAMNEYLNLGILAVRKVLGADHEAAVIAQIGDIQ